jgi:hypothetical protein
VVKKMQRRSLGIPIKMNGERSLGRRENPGERGAKARRECIIGTRLYSTMTYGATGRMICVDTPRKLVIIAIGGKIGHSSPSYVSCLPSEQKGTDEDHPPAQQHDAVVKELEVAAVCQGVGKRQIRDDYGPVRALTERREGTTLVGLAPRQ